ncbi:MAG TPA: PAS domain-containing sensor histidine kinase [Steroidobacteraceae bacterium]|nr:PAS domain-containing sensor histidine kinase [Steroidobacteraceae bacterium]
MTPRAPGTTRDGQDVHDELAVHEGRLAELERSQRCLQHLYDISELLARFQTWERTIPMVVSAIAETLPLHSATFILEIGGTPRTITWQLAGESARGLRAAQVHAREVYRYLVRSPVEFKREETRTLEVSPTAVMPEAQAGQNFVMLPFSVGRRSVFGALQIESVRELEERDLSFVDAVVNQLATALDRNASERALRASEARLAGIISIAADAIICVDEAQHIVMYNDAAQRTFGWTRDEVLGKPHDMLVPERFRESHRRHIGSFAAAADTARMMGEHRPEIIGLRKNGEEFPAEAAVSKLNAEGAWLFTVVLRDITEQKRIEREQVFLGEIGAIFATSLDSQRTLTNIARVVLREFADFCLIEFADEHGDVRQLEVGTSDPDKAGIAEALKRLPVDRGRPHLSRAILQSKEPQLTAEVTSPTIRAIAQNDEYRRLLEAIAPTSMMGVPLTVHGRLLGALVVASCRHERRYAAADLHLLEEVARRAALALENARLYHAAQQAVQARDQVLGIVAHDLRNPLDTIVMQAMLLRRRGGEPERIERAASRINRLIQDLLDVTRIEAGRLSIDPARVQARQVIMDSLEAQQELLSSSSLEVQLQVTPDLPELWVDRDRLLQVFENLMGNAAKFTGAGGRVTIGARPSEEEILFWVADTGIGISADDLPHVFDRFWQARKAERRGSGLGLPIVKGIVEAHGGHVWVESVPGRGSTFYFTVPAAQPVVDRAGEAPSATDQ